MNRRDVLLSGIALAGAAVVKGAQAAEHDHSMMMDHSTMDHGSMHAHHHDHPYASLATAASDCLQKGQACLSHCLVLLGDGDKDMADCAKSVNQMLALCGALQQIANQNSKLVAKQAALALEACNQCAEACKKHADKHEECKACGESCVACAKECKKLSA